MGCVVLWVSALEVGSGGGVYGLLQLTEVTESSSHSEAKFLRVRVVLGCPGLE